MADLSLLFGRGTARFAPDTRFDGAEPAAAMPADAPPPVAPPIIDPLGAAHDAGFATGHAAGYAEALALAQADHATRAHFTAAFTRLDGERTETLRQRLLDTVVALCEATLAPLALDMPALARRTERAAALFARADDDRVIRLSPADLAAVQPLLPPDWTLRPDPALAPGALRVEASTGGAEDGPVQWRAAIAAALDLC